MTAILSLLCLAFMGYIVAKVFGKIDFVKLLVCSVCGFFFLYTVVSAIFFWLDCFSFQKALLDCLVAEAVAGLLLWRRRPPVRIYYDYRESLIPLLIAVCALPFVWNKFELYSMGQDQGTYQVKALYLMERDTHNYIEMEEFKKLTDPEERQKYLDFIYEQNNLYLPRVEWETDYDASHFDSIVGTIHGLPTYSALLGLWGTIFGYEDMIGVQTPLYLCILFLSFYICQNLGLRKRTGALVTALMAGSPIMVWLAKSSLTETGLALIVLAFVYFLTERENRSWCAGIPLIVFSFFHISMYVFMPVFVVVLLGKYLEERDKGWLIALDSTIVGFFVSSLWAFDIAPYYSYGNYTVLWKLLGRILNEHNTIWFVGAACGVILALSAFLRTGRGTHFSERTMELLGAAKSRKAAALVIRITLAAAVLYFVYKGIIKAEFATYCEYLQISTYIYMTGMLLVPIVCLWMFFRTNEMFGDGRILSLSILFLYCVVAYSAFMRLHVKFYYYYARYVALFLIVIFLLAALIVEKLERRWRFSWIVLGMAFLTFLPYDRGFIVQKDHTRCEWDFLEDVCEDITERDAFIVGPEEQQIVFIFPVKILTGCDVYYADENLDEQLAKLAGSYEHVYYMDYDTAFEDAYGDSEALKEFEVKKVYTNWNHLSYLDYFNITNPWTPIPLNYVEYRLKLSLYQIGSEVDK